MKRSREDTGSPSRTDRRRLVRAVKFIKKATETSALLYESLSRLLVDFKKRKINRATFTRRLKDLLKGEDALLREFNFFLSEGQGIRLVADRVADQDTYIEFRADGQNPKQEIGFQVWSEFQEVLDFVNKIKIRFSLRTYKVFLDLMMMCKTGAKTVLQLYVDLAVIFAGHDDLIEELDGIVLGCGDYVDSGALGDYVEAIVLFKKMKAILRNSGKFLAVLNLFHLYSNRTIHKHDLLKGVADLIGDCPLLDELRFFLKGFQGGKSELDLSGCKQITPSYRLLPKEHQIPASIHRSKLGNEVLNDQLKCVSKDDFAETPEEGESRTMSPTEEAMFDREDEMYETDMLISTIRAAIKYGEQLLDGIKQEPPLHFSRVIENLYGDCGMEVLEIFHEDPIQTLATITPRLRQKLEDLLNYHSEQRMVT